MTLLYFVLSVFVSLNALASDIKKDLFLVVGSTRADSTEDNVISNLLHVGAQTDCTHEHTWHGLATTLDLKPCENDCGPHLAVDATTFDFSPYTIRKVFFERMDTGSSAVGEAGNLIGAILKNLKPCMGQGATLEIELDPFLCFRAYPSLSDDEADIDECRRQNPFLGCYNYRIIHQALVQAVNPNFEENDFRANLIASDSPFSETNVQAVLQNRERLRAWLDKIAAITAIAVDTLGKRVEQEMDIYHKLRTLNEQDPKSVPLVAIFAGGAALSCEDFTVSYENHEVLIPPSQLVGPYLNWAKSYLDKTGIVRTLHFYHINEFFTHCLSNVILGFLTVEQNKAFIVDYLEKLGFTQVTVEFGDSPYNGRKNYWMVTAVNL